MVQTFGLYCVLAGPVGRSAAFTSSAVGAVSETDLTDWLSWPKNSFLLFLHAASYHPLFIVPWL